MQRIERARLKQGKLLMHANNPIITSTCQTFLPGGIVLIPLVLMVISSYFCLYTMRPIYSLPYSCLYGKLTSYFHMYDLKGTSWSVAKLTYIIFDKDPLKNNSLRYCNDSPGIFWRIQLCIFWAICIYFTSQGVGALMPKLENLIKVFVGDEGISTLHTNFPIWMVFLYNGQKWKLENCFQGIK